MEKPEDLLRDLVTQVSRVAFALETIAIQGHPTSCEEPCKSCGCTLRFNAMTRTTCPACKTENAR